MMWFCLLVIQLVLAAEVQGSWSLASVNRCDLKRSLMAWVNSSMDVCCRLEPAECNRTTANDTLTLEPLDWCSGRCQGNITRLENCQVKLGELRLDGSADEYNGQLKCKKNGVLLSEASFYFVDREPAPIIEDVIFMPGNDVIVTFKRGENWDPKKTVDYEVKMLGSRGNVILCSRNRSLCGDGESRCICHHFSNPASYRELCNENVTIIVNGTYPETRPSVAQKEYRVMAHVRPTPVMRLNALRITAIGADVQFCMHNTMESLHMPMKLSGQPLKYHMRVIRTQGIPEVVQMTMTVSVKCTNCAKCTKLRLPDLTPYTKYTVVVWGSGGGGKGKSTSMDFITAKSVPTQPPVVDVSGFSVAFNSTALDEHVFGLQLMWKALPQAARGGDVVVYVVEVTDGNGLPWNNITTFQIHALFEAVAVPVGPLTAKIWAQNELGRSAIYSQISVPLNDYVKPKFQVELYNNYAYVYIDPEDDTISQLVLNTSELAVHHCVGYVTNEMQEMDKCQTFPGMKKFPVKSLSSGVLKVPLSEHHHHEESTENRTVFYYQLKSLNQKSCASGKLTAIARQHPRPEELVVKDYDYSDYPEVNSDYYEYEYYDECSGETASPDVVSAQGFTQKQTSNGTAEKKNLYHRVFVSLQLSDVWQGMVPASCYFNRTSDSAQLNIWLDDNDQNSETITLKWQQNCDRTRPSQFRADSFQVFTSQDENCKKDLKFMNTVKNQVARPVELKLPRDAGFACIRSNRALHNLSTFPQVKRVTSLAGKSGSDLGLPTVLGIVFGIFALVLILVTVIIIRYCRRRQKHFSKMEKTSTVKTLSGGQQLQLHVNGTEVPPTLPPKRDLSFKNNTVTSSGSSNSADSGRGSGSAHSSENSTGKGGQINDAFTLSSSERSVRDVDPNGLQPVLEGVSMGVEGFQNHERFSDRAGNVSDVIDMNDINHGDQVLMGTETRSSGEESVGKEDADSEQQKELAQLGLNLNTLASENSSFEDEPGEGSYGEDHINSDEVFEGIDRRSRGEESASSDRYADVENLKNGGSDRIRVGGLRDSRGDNLPRDRGSNNLLRRDTDRSIQEDVDLEQQNELARCGFTFEPPAGENSSSEDEPDQGSCDGDDISSDTCESDDDINNISERTEQISISLESPMSSSSSDGRGSWQVHGHDMADMSGTGSDVQKRIEDSHINERTFTDIMTANVDLSPATRNVQSNRSVLSVPRGTLMSDSDSDCSDPAKPLMKPSFVV